MQQKKAANETVSTNVKYQSGDSKRCNPYGHGTAALIKQSLRGQVTMKEISSSAEKWFRTSNNKRQQYAKRSIPEDYNLGCV
ncbi:hypothetical protein Trydic_g16526 [Trypoxylus dichotomus]